MKNLFFVFLSLACLTLSCKKNDYNSEQKPSELTYFQAFKDRSIFYTPIPDSVEIDPNSSIMVQSLIEEAREGIVIAVKSWTVAVYYANNTTPRVDVKMTASWAPKKTLKDVPIPPYAEPDPSDDGSMVIIDQENGCIYDFWRMRYSFGSWKASWGNALELNSDGIFPKGLSARGSGFELLQGVIWPHELEAGEINHALVFSYDYTKAGGPVPPATESDGTSDDPRAIPEGALIQLDPDLDLVALGLTGYELTIARAMQKYGMYLCDDGGGLQLYAINPICVGGNPYEQIWGDQEYVFLKKIPVDRFRVIKLPPQYNPELDIVPGKCNNFE